MARIDQKESMKDLFNPIAPFRDVCKSRNLLRQLVKRNIQTRYKGSMLGLFWLFATPLCMLAVYTFVFSVVFKTRWGTDVGDSKTAFALTIFCGLSVFNIFSESVTGAVGIISGNPNYVKKVVFPLEVLPVASLLSAFFFGLIWICILVLGVAIFMQKMCLTALCLPVILLPLLLLSCGLSWFVASLGVYLRDLAHAVGILLLMLFFMTPIFYSMDMVPTSYRTALRLNPLTDIVQNSRRVLIFGQWPSWTTVGLLMICSLVVFQFGYVWFMKTKRGFADVL
ncbi:MAG: ABC transporter permease [Phycisphaerales bacterium]|nr:MAG: ABC transporter permease [Phycisphaerales bacterium]